MRSLRDRSLRRALQVKAGVQRASPGTASSNPNGGGGGVPGRELARPSPWARGSSRGWGGAVVKPGQARRFSLRRRRAQLTWHRTYGFVKSERLSAIGPSRVVGLQVVPPTAGHGCGHSIRVIGRQGVSSAGGDSRTKQAAVEQRDATDKGREVCPLRLPLMGAVVEGGLCS